VTLAELEAKVKSGRRRDRRCRQVIDLAFARTALGRDWERIAPRLAKAVAIILEQQIGHRGCFAHDGECYHILLEGMSEREAHARVAKVAAIIARLLPGKSDDASSHAAIAALTGGGTRRQGWLRRTLHRVGGIFRRGKARAADRTEAISAPPQSADKGEPTSPAVEAAGSLTPHSTMSTRPQYPSRATAAYAPLSAAQAAQAPALIRASSQPVQKSYLPQPTYPQEPQAGPRPRAKTAAALKRLGAPREFPPPGLAFVYQPFWDVRGNRIASYISTPVCEGEDGMLEGHEVLPLPAELRHVIQLDELAIRQLAKDLPQSPADAGASVIVPVHFATISESARRKNYMLQYGEISSALRSRMILEIKDVPDDASTPLIEAVIRDLRPFTSAIAVELPLHQWDLRRWKKAGVTAVGVNRTRSSMKETEFVTKFNRFTMLATDAVLKSYLKNADTLSLSVAAVGAGTTLLSGHVIADYDMSKRFEVVPYSVAHLYEQALPAAATTAH